MLYRFLSRFTLGSIGGLLVLNPLSASAQSATPIQVRDVAGDIYPKEIEQAVNRPTQAVTLAELIVMLQAIAI